MQLSRKDASILSRIVQYPDLHKSGDILDDATSDDARIIGRILLNKKSERVPTDEHQAIAKMIREWATNNEESLKARKAARNRTASIRTAGPRPRVMTAG